MPGAPHFFGFLDRRLRSCDFALGYDCMLTWMKDPQRGLRARGVAAQHANDAVRTAEDRKQDAWIPRKGLQVRVEHAGMD